MKQIIFTKGFDDTLICKIVDTVQKGSSVAFNVSLSMCSEILRLNLD